MITMTAKPTPELLALSKRKRIQLADNLRSGKYQSSYNGLLASGDDFGVLSYSPIGISCLLDGLDISDFIGMEEPPAEASEFTKALFVGTYYAFDSITHAEFADVLCGHSATRGSES